MNWIKLEHQLHNKPEVLKIARLLKLSKYDVVGRLYAVWCWLDNNTKTGEDVPITDDDIDDMAECSGMASAMRSAGWLIGDQENLTFPNYTRHNGETAKKRAETNRRVAKCRTLKAVEKEQVDDKVTEKTLQECNENVTQNALPHCNGNVTKKALPEKSRISFPPYNPPPQGSFPAVEEVERQLQSDVFAGRVRIAPEQVKTVSEIYWASRDAVNWTRNGIPVSNWQSDLRSYALNWSRNNPVSAGVEDPYARMEIL